jgi:hypothetical protein
MALWSSWFPAGLEITVFSETWPVVFAQLQFSFTFAVLKRKGSLAQLVQSICLTSRGSGVRTPQLPLKSLRNSEAFLFPNASHSPVLVDFVGKITLVSLNSDLTINDL